MVAISPRALLEALERSRKLIDLDAVEAQIEKLTHDPSLRRQYRKAPPTPQGYGTLTMEARIRLLTKRVADGVSLWHPNDVLPDAYAGAPVRTYRNGKVYILGVEVFHDGTHETAKLDDAAVGQDQAQRRHASKGRSKPRVR